ncbi:unnamed protein product [Caenorhabditis bovis]|uniref:D-2-hydroxyglutarate dehydrogenase, mitochondrial n=1 Tax=Caenorhabditis bovis TaxID=2654633 RepID=A0A8S1ER64_9PELO|nr:unnamed protein product [Caenorhabditis bovis]
MIRAAQRLTLLSSRSATTLQRDPRFAKLEETDIKAFESCLGKDSVLTSDIETYTSDWTKQFGGKGSIVLLPRSTEEVSKILKYCSQRKLAVVPQSGNTGLVGGSVPIFDEIVVSINRINQQYEFDATSGVLKCDAGHILQELDERLAPTGHMMPFDLGAKGSCRIGGNIATCAGGIRLLRYGSLHAHLLGLTAVLPDENGTILNLGSAIRKDNTSFHSPHLFLGSEGKLGIVTNVTMTVASKPLSVQTAMLGIESFENCKKTLLLAKSRLSEILSSFEFMDEATIECLEENSQLKRVLESKTPFTILIETSGSNEDHDQEKVSKFLEECMETGLVVDGSVAGSAGEAAHMWSLREHAPVAVMRDGYVFKHDVSLPFDNFYKLTEEMTKQCAGLAKRVISYGHLGDGNIHLNISAEKSTPELYAKMYPYVYEWVTKHGGSISAEHGIGLVKLPYSHFGKQPEERELMRRLKDLFDPNGIMNPYKFI